MAHMSEELVIEALDIHKSFGDLEILKGISCKSAVAKWWC